MSVLRAIAVFLCGVYSLRLIKAQIVLPGTCPDVQAMTDFDPNRVNIICNNNSFFGLCKVFL